MARLYAPFEDLRYDDRLYVCEDRKETGAYFLKLVGGDMDLFIKKRVMLRYRYCDEQQIQYDYPACDPVTVTSNEHQFQTNPLWGAVEYYFVVMVTDKSEVRVTRSHLCFVRTQDYIDGPRDVRTYYLDGTWEIYWRIPVTYTKSTGLRFERKEGNNLVMDEVIWVTVPYNSDVHKYYMFSLPDAPQVYCGVQFQFQRWQGGVPYYRYHLDLDYERRYSRLFERPFVTSETVGNTQAMYMKQPNSFFPGCDPVTGPPEVQSLQQTGPSQTTPPEPIWNPPQANIQNLVQSANSSAICQTDKSRIVTSKSPVSSEPWNVLESPASPEPEDVDAVKDLDKQIRKRLKKQRQREKRLFLQRQLEAMTEATSFTECMTVTNIHSQMAAPNESLQITAPNVHSQMTARNAHSLMTTPNVHSQMTAPNVHSQITAPNVHSQMTTRNVHSQMAAPNESLQIMTAPNVHSQMTASNVHSQMTAPNVHLQKTTPSVHSQMTAPNIHSQTAVNMHSQKTAPSVHSQMTAPSVHSQMTAPKTHSQMTAPNVHLQMTAPNIHSQVTAPNVQLQMTALNVHSQMNVPYIPEQITGSNVYSQMTAHNVHPQMNASIVHVPPAPNGHAQRAASNGCEQSAAWSSVSNVLAQRSAAIDASSIVSSGLSKKQLKRLRRRQRLQQEGQEPTVASEISECDKSQHNAASNVLAEPVIMMF